MLDVWHTVYATRVRTLGTLAVDGGATVSRQSRGTTTQLNVIGGVFLGGVGDYSIVSSMAGSEVGFIGCVDTLQVSIILIFEQTISSKMAALIFKSE